MANTLSAQSFDYRPFRLNEGTDRQPAAALDSAIAPSYSCALQSGDAPLQAHALQSLLQRIASGDREAFWTFWQSVEADIYRVGLGQLGGNVDDAQDALALVRLKTFEMLPQLTAELRQPMAWLKQVARNLCCDLGRSRSRRETRVTALETLDGEIADPRSDGADPLKALMNSAAHGSVVTRIDGLPARLREVTALRFLGELSYSSIATQLSITEATARKRVQEARHILASTRAHPQPLPSRKGR